MESIPRMSNPYQLGRVESNDTAVGSGIFNNPKYEVGDAITRTRTTGDDFNLQLTKDNYDYDNSVNNDLTGNTITSEASAGAARGSGSAVMTAFEDYLDLDLEAMQLQQHLQQQQQLQLQQMQLHLQQQQRQQQQQQQKQQQFLPMLPKRDSSRRLSISDYDVDNAGYYEYEYFGKPSFQIGDSSRSSSNTRDYNDRADVNLNDKNNEVMNEPFADLDFKLSAGSTTATNNNNDNNINNANFLQDEVVMMSDEDWGTPSDETAVQMGRNNDLFDFVPQSQSLEVPMVEDYNLDVDVDAPLIEPQQPPKKKVKDYFKLNFFTNNSNNNNSNNNNTSNTSNGSGNGADLVVGDEPVFKKKYFWNRNPMKRRARQDDPLEMEEDHTLVNPSQLVTFSNEYDDDDSHTVSEPLTQFAVFDNLEDKLPAAVIDPAQTPVTTVNHVEPVAPMAVTTTTDNIIDNNNSNSNSDSNTTATPSPPPLVRKRLGSMPKTRGRKPSPILDATKHFGCEYCDRRFKRQEHLKRHVRSLHMCEKPFGCHICGKKFSRSDNLNQHIKTHTHQ
ncbi:ZYRO0G19140p [Zygosaccharomyces rouxii]|uniref:ZYRO0G19140p n=1 Tax=Zygosaccharomyces rouxii (strain ATCC 2623 / CBS 732 / NBRC 1130 / NCYC 568 / NRRL Y-229) TaxID=559307 RepID=C5E196_ZYGRC|nr:uncharacterized protein ZYRO0G19140g [Zygosaccharomyces rouxii]KAH9202873.1 hypothetical protein LQ764DRAFT_55745 [Zygosaccharomyces rouxii]CAR29880.1 ZYRO0G19140p [Zygosaccharomyces rouxii]